MKGLAVLCSGCKEWGQGGIRSMFKVGPSGKLDAEAKAFVFLKMFYEGSASLPYIKNWNKKVKGLQDSNIPLTINENSEDDEWILNGENEEEGGIIVYTLT